MSYSSFLKPRPEVISEQGVEGIIDLANLKDVSQTKIESRPKDFFNLTWPTTDVIKVLEQIDLRFSLANSTAGLFLFEGLKGSGKSHLLLLIYNFFQYPQVCQEWLTRNGLKYNIPEDITVIINKFTDNPHEAIWDMIFEALGHKPQKGKTHPKLKEFEKALGDRRLILIFDELEQGIKVINDPALQAQNIAFLQMLSEFSNRSQQVTLFASIYSDRVEPGSTLKRVPRCVVQFDNAKDQSNIILHRLFENFRETDKRLFSSVIESYVQLWRKHTKFDQEDLKQRFNDSYPFSPSLLDIIFKKIPARGGFQNVRGALAFLGNLVRLTYLANDIITPADASLKDKATTIMLKDLDPSGDLINRAKENMEELVSKVPLAQKIASTVLLYTLAGSGSNIGVSREQLLWDILSPSADINSFEQTMIGFQKNASYFYDKEGKYFFDLPEKPEAKVEFKSAQYLDDQSREKLFDLLKTEVFRETVNTTVFVSLEQAQEMLKQFDKTRLRYILTGRRLTQEERHQIYFGMDKRNLILLLEPKDDQFQLSSDKDLLKWAKRLLAAKDLAHSTSNASRQAEYDRISRQEQGYIVERIKRAGLVLVSWEEYGSTVSEDRIELELLPGDFSKDKVLDKLTQDYFPMLRFKEHLERRIEQITNRLVKEIDDEYRSTLGFPVPANIRFVSNAIRELCKHRVIGIQHSAGNFCFRNPDLNETELFNAKITPPFEDSPPKLCLRCGKSPCQCPQGSEMKPCPVCGQLPCECAIPDGTCTQCKQKPCVCPKKEVVSLRVPPQTSIDGLRQEAAFRLQQPEGSVVTRVTYKIFFQKSNIGDLSILPSGLRGNLNGSGDISAEITITKTGNFFKAQIEQQIEALPVIPEADYSVDLMVEVLK
jgi:hypothetical protein